VFAQLMPAQKENGPTTTLPPPLVRCGLPELLQACAANDHTNQARLVLFGEEHGHPTAHALQAAVLGHLLRRSHEEAAESTVGSSGGGGVTLSLEMLDSAKQCAADAYASQLLSAAATLAATSEEEALFAGDWQNWPDYAPMLRAVRRFNSEELVSGQEPQPALAAGVEPKKQLARHRVLAANAPRRFTSAVAKGGLVGLADVLALNDAADRALLAPLPWMLPSAALAEKCGPLFATFRGVRDDARKDRMLLAQSLWDATMAWRLHQELCDSPARTVLHLCGRFHTEHGLGIPEHLRAYSAAAAPAPAAPATKAAASEGTQEFGREWSSRRDQIKIVAFVSSDDFFPAPEDAEVSSSNCEEAFSDSALASDPYLRSIADFVVLCESNMRPAQHFEVIPQKKGSCER
jgi:hypothetical protein